MKINDKLIKELLKEGFLTEAPEGFTHRVMKEVAEQEIKNETFSSFLVYFLVLAGATGMALVSLYFTNKELLAGYYAGLKIFVTGFFTSSVHNLSATFSYLHLPQTGFFAGIILTIVVLLLMDKLFFNKKQELNLFI